jgi:elongation factor 3
MSEMERFMVGLKCSETSQQVLDLAIELGLFLQGRCECIPLCLSQLDLMATDTCGLGRESGVLGFVGVVRGLGKGGYPFVESHVPLLLKALADKGQPVRDAADRALDAILDTADPLVCHRLFPFLYDAMRNKWQHKVGALRLLEKVSRKATDEIGFHLPIMIPNVSECMHDTKTEVSKAAMKCMSGLCKVVANPDMDPHIDLLVDCMAHPDHVSTVFLLLTLRLVNC